MRKLIIKEDLVIKVLNYLANKPYIETYELIGEIQKLQPIDKGEPNGTTES